MLPIDLNRLLAAKAAFSTRRFDMQRARTLLQSGIAPAAGDLVLARIDKPGHHDGVELTTGRRATLYAGDEVLICYGHRYAPDQFEAVVPDDLGPCHMVAAGGIAGLALSWHASMRSPTEITPVGIVGDGGGAPLNVYDYRVGSIGSEIRIPIILSVGTSMNSGKTTTAAKLIHGLSKAGLAVGAAKITGTSAGKDTWLMRDSGAQLVLDFNDAGYATTYKVPVNEIEAGARRLVGHLQAKGAEIAVVEVADGLLQQETRDLLERPTFRHSVSAVIFSSLDSMGAVTGTRWLQQQGYHVPFLAGVMTNSPLASREASCVTGLPVMRLAELQSASIAAKLLRPPVHQGRVKGGDGDHVALIA